MPISPTPSVQIHRIAQAHAGRALQVTDSQPRQSRLHYLVRVTGIGETRLTGQRALQFGMLLLTRPAFSSGVIAEGQIPLNSMPLTSAMVLNYLTNSNGLYVGAELGFVIQPAEFGKPFSIPLQFTLAFEAAAMRTTAGVDGPLGVESGPNQFQGELG